MPKISQFPAGGSAQNTDLIPVVRNGRDYTVTGAALAALANYSQAYAGTFTATAGQTVFTLPASPGSLANLFVSVDGAVQVPGVDYTWTTPTTLTFTVGLTVGQTVLYRYTSSVPNVTPSAGGTNNQIQYNNSGVLNGFTMSGDVTVVPTTGVATIGAPSSRITYTQGDTGSVSRTVTSKLQESVSVQDFGAVGDGITDDTAAIQAACNASIDVVIPPGTYLISATIYVLTNTKLTFKGKVADPTAAVEKCYLIKKSTMTTPALSLSDHVVVDGGGVVGQAGNTGDGVSLLGNGTKIRDFLVQLTGGNGIRVGDSSGTNCNSFELDTVTSRNNGGHGIYIHDGRGVSGPNTNAGTLIQCFAQYNTGDGINLGHCWWNVLINCLTEENTGYGLYLSGIANNTYPECRWVTSIGGAYNNGNVAGQVYDTSYLSTFIQPDQNAVPNTAASGLQGGGLRTIIGAYTKNILRGLTIDSSVLTLLAGASYFDLQAGQIKFPSTQRNSFDVNTLDDYEEGTWTPAQAGVTLTVGSATFTKIGRLVQYTFDLTWPTTADATAINITGWIHAALSNSGTVSVGYTTYANVIIGTHGAGGLPFYNAGGVPSTQLTNANLSAKRVIASGTYYAAT